MFSMLTRAKQCCKNGACCFEAVSRLEATDKIALPFSYANQIYQRAERGQELQLPLGAHAGVEIDGVTMER